MFRECPGSRRRVATAAGVSTDELCLVDPDRISCPRKGVYLAVVLAPP